MAPTGLSNLHVDPWQTDRNRWFGPLGRNMSRTSSFQIADCASHTFDSRDRVVIPTTTRHVLVIGQTEPAGFKIERDYDVTGAVGVGDAIISALPDFSGRIWFVSVKGVIGTIDPASGAVA